MVAGWLAGVVLVSTIAANPHVTKATELYDSMRYPEAEARLRIARDAPGTTLEERREIVDLLARSIIAQGRTEEAEGIYAELLAFDPATPNPPNASPKITETFLRAKRKVYPPNTARLERLAASPTTLRVRLIDPWQLVVSVTLVEGLTGKAMTESVLKVVNGEYNAIIGGDGRAHQAYVEARNARSEAVARLGSPTVPLLFEAGEGAALVSTPVVVSPEVLRARRRWPAWVIAVVSVVALGVGAGFAVSAASDSTSAGKSDVARDIRMLDGSARDKAIAANGLIGGALVGGAGAAVLFLVL